jgi:hypothetical protein
MTNAISSGRLGGVSATLLGGASGGRGGVSAAMAGLAATIAGTIAGELNLPVDPDGRRQPFAAALDLYGVEETADSLIADVGGNSADKGIVAQALHRFAQEIASLVAAQPDSRALEWVRHAIDQASAVDTSAQNISSLLSTIERATALIAGQKS